MFSHSWYVEGVHIGFSVITMKVYNTGGKLLYIAQLSAVGFSLYVAVCLGLLVIEQWEFGKRLMATTFESTESFITPTVLGEFTHIVYKYLFCG